MFREEDIEEFQKLFLQEFGYTISVSEALEYAEKLIALLRVTYEDTAPEC